MSTASPEPATRVAPSVAVIGAGASGLMAALYAAWNGAAVTLFERNDAIGRKLLVTGSGRCNLTNDAVRPEAYANADPSWLAALLSTFGRTHLLETLQRIGIPTRATHDGWYYPLSESAASVVEAFSAALDEAGVTRQMASPVTNLERLDDRWLVSFTSGGTGHCWTFDRVILSAGGKAMPALGSRGELFGVLQRLGHTVLPLRPALAPLLVDLGRLKPLQGLHFDVGASLYAGNEQLGRTFGNLILTAWGLNGPAVMDLSHLVSARPGASLTLSLDLLAPFQREYDALLAALRAVPAMQRPHVGGRPSTLSRHRRGASAGSVAAEVSLSAGLAARRTTPMPLTVFLSGFFPPKAARLFTQLVGLREETLLSQMSDAQLRGLTARLNDMRFIVKGVRDWEFCQTSAGGVPVTEVDPLTMASHLLPGLYLTGETLDAVGPCGGYNLQFAFSTGAVAGQAAGRAR